MSVQIAPEYAEIADYTIERFGIEQARRYRDDLESCFQTLAASPMIGRSADELGSNLRRYKHQSHIVFYLPSDQGVFVVRVLHQRMDYAIHW
jgi:toxin ParE1/3/4